MGLASDETLGEGRESALITPNDTAELPRMRGIHVGATGGDIVGRLRNDSANRTFPVNPNTFYPYDFKLVAATGTTATTLHAIR